MSLFAEFLEQNSNEQVYEQLFENARGSYRHGLMHFNNGGPQIENYKYAIMHLAHAIELVLKSILARHGRLLFIKEIDKRGRCRTVNVHECCERLKEHCDIKIDEARIERIEGIRELRNDIEHFAPTASPAEMRKTALSVMSDVASMIDDFLGKKISQYLDGTLIGVLNEADKETTLLRKAAEKSIADFVKGLREDQATRYGVRDCWLCHQQYCVVDQERSHYVCHFCGFERKIGRCEKCGFYKIVERVEGGDTWLCGLCK